MSSSHHPQTDGQTERTNRTMEEMLRHFVNYRQNNWDEVLPALEHAYNNSVNATTRQVPFELLYGQKPLEFKDFLLPSPTTTVESVTDSVSRKESLVADASKSIAQANQTAERHSNRKRMGPIFGVGDNVLLSTKHFTLPAYQGRKRKLAGKFAGPYEVVQVVSPVVVKLSLPSGTKAHPVFHTSMLRPYCYKQYTRVIRIDTETVLPTVHRHFQNRY
jgi:hypothetical protein